MSGGEAGRGNAKAEGRGAQQEILNVRGRRALDPIARGEGEPPLDLDALQRTLDPERLVEETREQIAESGEEEP